MKPHLEQLPIRIRRVATDGRPVEPERSVHCPVRHTSMDIHDCEQCERRVSTHLTRTGSGSYVACTTDRDHRARDGWSYLLRKILPPVVHRTRLAEVISGTVTCVTADVGADQLAALFLAERLDAVPVVDREGHPFGVVTKTDLVRDSYENGDTGEQATDGDARACEAVDGGCHVVEPTRRTVADLMTPIAFTLRDVDSLADATSVMQTEAVEQVPVVDQDGRVVGLFSLADFARWLTRQAELPPE